MFTCSRAKYGPPPQGVGCVALVIDIDLNSWPDDLWISMSRRLRLRDLQRDSDLRADSPEPKNQPSRP